MQRTVPPIVPELETERLRLRAWRESDLDPVAAHYADEEMARFLGGTVDRSQAWRRMATLVGHWALRGFGCWAVEEKSSEAFAGCVGLWHPEGWPELELGYWIVRPMQRKGYATEAGQRSRRFAYEELGATTLVSFIHADNVASVRVAEKLGARYDGTVQLLTHGTHGVYRHPGPSDALGA